MVAVKRITFPGQLQVVSRCEVSGRHQGTGHSSAQPLLKNEDDGGTVSISWMRPQTRQRRGVATKVLSHQSKSFLVVDFSPKTRLDWKTCLPFGLQANALRGNASQGPRQHMSCEFVARHRLDQGSPRGFDPPGPSILDEDRSYFLNPFILRKAPDAHIALKEVTSAAAVTKPVPKSPSGYTPLNMPLIRCGTANSHRGRGCRVARISAVRERITRIGSPTCRSPRGRSRPSRRRWRTGSAHRHVCL